MRYGVVRNNWYHLDLQSVSGPGTPWIPDPSDHDPTNPTPPGTDDDESDAYLSVKSLSIHGLTGHKVLICIDKWELKDT